MALAINTSDALYASLSHLFGVDDDNVVKEFKAGLAVTVPADVRLPNSSTSPSSTAPFGRSFRNTNTTQKGVSFPAQAANGVNPLSVFLVINDYISGGGGATGSTAPMIGASSAGVKCPAGVHVVPSTGKVQPNSQNDCVVTVSGTLSNSDVLTGGHSIGFVREPSGGKVYLYIDGVLDTAFTGGLNNDGTNFGPNAVSDYHSIGGFQSIGNSIADYVYAAFFMGTALTAGDFSRLHASLTGGNAFALITTPLTAPTVSTHPASTSRSEGLTATFTAAFSGNPAPTLQWQRSTNSGSTWVDIASATAASYTTPATTITGGAANSGDQYRCRGSNSEGVNVATNAAILTVVAAGDTTAPTLTGALAASNVAQTGFTITGPTASDNVAVTGYDYSLDSGSTWLVTNWAAPTYNFVSLTPGATYQVRMRARDAAGNLSAALALPVTLLAGGGSFTSLALKRNNGSLLASTALSYVALYNVSTGALVVRKTGVSTDASGVFTFSDAALVSGTQYRVDWEASTGERRMPIKVAA